MSSDRRIQFFIEQIFPIIWDQNKVPVKWTYPSKHSDLKCRDISPALIELCVKAIWVKSKIVLNHWFQYFRKHYLTMVSSPKAFVIYMTYACKVTDCNTKDHYDRFVTVCSLVTGFGVNFSNGGNGQVIQYIPKILEVFFEVYISEQFNMRGGWKRFENYLSRQDYVSWHDEILIDPPNETKEQKLARELNFNKKVEIAVMATYSLDYSTDFMSVKDIECDLRTIKITEEVMAYFPEQAPSPREEFQRVKKIKCNVTDEACDEGGAKRGIIDDMFATVKHLCSDVETNKQAENDGSSTQQLTETTNSQNATEKTGVSESVSTKVATSSKRRRSSKKKKQDASSNSEICEFVPINENLSVSRISDPQYEETNIEQTETSIGHTTHANSDDNEFVPRNRQTSKETNKKTAQEKSEDKSNSGLRLFDASVLKGKTLKKKLCASVSSTSYSGALDDGEFVSSNRQTSKESNRKAEKEKLEAEFNTMLQLLQQEAMMQSMLKKIQGASCPSATNFGAEASNEQKKSVNLECSELLSSKKKNSKETKQITKIDVLEKNDLSSIPAAPTMKLNTTKEHNASVSSITQSVEESSKQKTSANLGCIQSFSGNQQTKKIKQKNRKKTGSDIAPGNLHSSKKSTEPKFIDVKTFKSDPSNDSPNEYLTEKESEIIPDDEPSKVQQSTDKDAISNLTESASVSNNQKVSKKRVKSVSKNQQFTKEINESTSLPIHSEFPDAKLPKTSEKTEDFFSISTLLKSTEFTSKSEAGAEIKSITESLAPKLEELAVVIASLLWDLRCDV